MANEIAYDDAFARQEINRLIPNNNSQLVKPEHVRTVQNTVLDVVTAAIQSANDTIDTIFKEFSDKDEIGTYNASTNQAKIRNEISGDVTLTPTTTPAQANGKSFRVIVEGTQSITGTSTLMKVGGWIVSRDMIKWDYIPPTDTGYAKSLDLEKLISNTTVEDYAFVWADIDKKVCGYIDRAGLTKFLRWVNNSIPETALANFTASNKIIAKTITMGLLSDDVAAHMASFINIPGYRFVWNDSTGRYAIAVDEAGTVYVPRLSTPMYIPKKLIGKKILCIGDSTSAALKYQPWIAEYTGMTVTTHAKGGIGLVQMVDGDGSNPLLALTAAQLLDKDFVTVYGALNDRSRLIGTRADVYPAQTTIYAVVKYVITSIYTLAATVGRKDIRVVLITPHKVGKYNYIDADGGQEYPTGSGQTLENICNAIIDIGGFYGIPVVDLYRNSGINNFTWDTLTANTVSGTGPYPANADNVHPNGAGYKLIGSLISSKLNNL